MGFFLKILGIFWDFYCSLQLYFVSKCELQKGNGDFNWNLGALKLKITPELGILNIEYVFGETKKHQENFFV